MTDSTRQLLVLYVEDNESLREMVVVLLESMGHRAVAVDSAERALEAFGAARFDVVLTDVSLPAMSGVDLARRVLELAPHTWVIVSSGYEWTCALEQLGPRVVSMPKPFDIEELEALLERVGT